MLVNINEDILELLKLDNLKETEDNKIMLENVVNAYMVGGIFTAVQQGALDVEKDDVKAMMDYYQKRIVLHVYKRMLTGK